MRHLDDVRRPITRFQGSLFPVLAVTLGLLAVTGLAGTAWAAAPPAPTTLVATPASSRQIDLMWKDNATTETNYYVERSPDGSSSWTVIATLGANSTSYQNTGLPQNTIYYYRVRCAAGKTYSSYSNTANATTATLAAPTGLAAAVVSASKISLSWMDVTAYETQYTVERSPNGSSSWTVIGTVSANSTTLTNTGLTAGTAYYYRVRAYDGTNYSTYSSIVNQTIRLITASTGANGSIFPNGYVAIANGANQAFTVNPNAGYKVGNVTVDGSSAGAVTSYTFNNITANHTISATFFVDTVTITASAGANGWTSPSGAIAVDIGANQMFDIRPNPGYRVSDVLVDGASVGAVTTYTFSNVTGPHTITASFTTVPPTASITSPATGSTNNKTPLLTYTVKAGVCKKGVFTGDGQWSLDFNGNNVWDGTPTDAQYTFGSGLAGAVPVTGDWTGDGRTKVGVYANGIWYLDLNGNGAWDGTPTDAQYMVGGVQGSIPVTGDWNGDGRTKIGVYDNGTWYLDYNGDGTFTGASNDRVHYFGSAASTPVTGDWNGSGVAKIGVYDNGTWHLDYNGDGTFTDAPSDRVYYFEFPASTPVTGDWNGDGKTEIGVYEYETGTWWLDDNGNGDYGMPYWFGPGLAGAVPVTGYWTGTGPITVVVKVDGVAVTKASGNNLDILADGPHTVRVESTDAAGSTGFAEAAFTIDTVGPFISIDPVSTPVSNSTQTITGTVESGALVTVTANTSASAGPVSYPTQTTWSCTVAGLVTGPNIITATATDAAGNTGSAGVTIALGSSVLPTVSIFAPTSGFTTSNTPSLSYSISDGTAVVKVDGMVVNKTSGDTLDALGDGQHTVQVEAVNAAGTGSAQITFTVDTVPPLTTKFPSISKISAGIFHSLAIGVDGSLWAWGSNSSGNLGDGTILQRNYPTKIGTDTTWTAISGGEDANLALKSDGSLWAWGWNAYGQLGDGTTEDRYAPVRIGNDNDWKTISLRGYHGVALKNDGTLWAWGGNWDGELGDGTTEDKHAPVQIGTDKDWVAISAGDYHNLAIKSNGTLWAWGWNRYGQLGDGTTDDRYVPVQIGSDTNWIAVSTQFLASFALKADGTLWAWGCDWWTYGYSGMLGDGGYLNQHAPVQIGMDNHWSAIAASETGLFTLALKSDGTLWAWGINRDGQFGNGTQSDSTVPVQIGTDTTWSSISAGNYHSLAMKSDGKVWSWGKNVYGALGDGTTQDSYIPQLRDYFYETATVLIINNGAGTTQSALVDLALNAWDTTSGVVSMRFSNNGTTWTAPEPYATTRAWMLTPGDGKKVVYVMFQDAAGNWSKAISSSIIFDATPPLVMISWPTTGNYTSAGPLYLLYGASDNLGYRWTTLLVDGIFIGSNVSNGWSLRFLSDGPHTIRVNAVDKAGNAAFAEVNITVAIPPPTVDITSPTAGSTNNSTPALNYTVSNGTATVKVDYAVVNKISGDALDYLVNGSHTVRVEAADTAGRYGYAEVSFTVEAPPRVIITSPHAGSTSNRILPLTYTVSDGTVVATVDGVTVNKVSGDALDALADGPHTVRVEATNAFGTGFAEVSFTVDSIPPAVAITSPFPGATKDATPALMYTVSSGTVVVKVDGVVVDKVSGSALDALSDGSHTVRLEATNASGTSITEVNFTVDTVAPTISIASPIAGITNTATPPLSYTVSDGSVIVRVDNAVVSTFSGSALDALPDGSHTARVEATDAVGNMNYAEVSFTVDTEPPSDSFILKFSKIDSGASQAAAIARNGTLWAWGAYSSNVPIQIGTEADWTAVSIDAWGMVALKSDGSLWNWAGSSLDGPTRIGIDADWTAVSLGEQHAIALKSDGSIWTWGDNTIGQLGVGEFRTFRNSPTSLTYLWPGYVSVSAGGHHTVALWYDGTIWATGADYYGQLGWPIGCPPYAIERFSASASDRDWAAISAGYLSTAALKTNGTLWKWGDGLSWPTQIGTDTNWSAVSAGSGYTMALKSDGTLWGWGVNTYGQLGDGSTADRYDPVKINNDTDWVAVSAGGYYTQPSPYNSDWYHVGFTLALKSDGTLWTWGYNGAGQLGDGTTQSHSAPRQVNNNLGSRNPIAINSGAVSTNNASVTLSLFAWDVTSGTAFMKFSNDGASWTAPEPYATTKAWTLSPGDGVKHVYVMYQDKAGNWSSVYSSSIMFSGTGAPVVAIISPVAGFTNSINPLLTYLVSDGTVVVKVDGNVVDKISGDVIDAPTNGSYTVRVEATNGYGTGFDQVQFTVDTVPPTVAISSPVAGTSKNRTPTLTHTSSDGTALVTVDGKTVAKNSGDTLDALTDGRHTVQVKATDAAGNTGSAQVSFVVDNTPPTIYIGSPAEGLVNTTSIPVVYGVSDGTVSVTVDGMGMNIASGSTLGGLGNGSHTITVYSTDIAGNTGSKSVTFMVDTLAGNDDTNIYCQGTGTVIVGPSSFTSGIPVPSSDNTVLIAAPSDGATITGSNAIVKGSMDTTVPVNSVMIVVTSGTGTAGYLAQVNGHYFAAKVPVTAETTTITAVATDQNGAKHQASVSVSVANQPSYVDLLATPNVGIPVSKNGGQAALNVSLISTPSTTHPVINYAWDFDGSGMDAVTCYSHNSIIASYQQTGLYLSKVAVMDTAGNRYADTVIVNVADRAEIDALLKSKWDDMKNALIAENTAEALNHIAPASRQKYSEAFATLQANISQIASGMQNIELVYVSDEVAKCRIRRDQIINGQMDTISYYIYFTKDSNGVWQIQQF